jgi:hypothetical protein
MAPASGLLADPGTTCGWPGSATKFWD